MIAKVGSLITKDVGHVFLPALVGDCLLLSFVISERTLCWSSVGPLLTICWSSVGLLLAFCWSSTGLLLVFCWSSIGPLLVDQQRTKVHCKFW